MQQWDEILTPVYTNRGVHIFAVNGQFSGAMPMTTIEEVPQVDEGEEMPVQDQEGVLQPDRGFEFPDLERAKEEARTLLAEMAVDGLPQEPVDSIAVELQDANRVPIVTFRLVLEAIPHGAQQI